jgi:type I restriction enzyme, R subunit
LPLDDRVDEEHDPRRRISDDLAVNIEIRPEDLMGAPGFAWRGGVVRARAVFRARLPALLDELTDTLAA